MAYLRHIPDNPRCVVSEPVYEPVYEWPKTDSSFNNVSKVPFGVTVPRSAFLTITTTLTNRLWQGRYQLSIKLLCIR